MLVTFSGMTLYGLPQAQIVSLSLLLLILPYFIFSSYAGKLADCYDKVKIVRIVKCCEVFICVVVAIGFYYKIIWLLMLALLLMGAHSAFFGPIKYSILPQYLPTDDLVMAIGYIEMGSFVSILIGQTLGSWFVASSFIFELIGILFLASLSGLYYSYKMQYVRPTGSWP